MWKSFALDNNYYIFKVDRNTDSVIVSLSDLQKVWEKKIDRNELIVIFQNLNPLLDQNKEDLFMTCLSLLSDSFIKSCAFLSNLDEVNLKFKDFIQELPIKLDITLKVQNDNNFLHKVTIPIIHTLQYLEFKQKKLEVLLSQKDKELMEYKMEYGDLTRKFLKTDKYLNDSEAKDNLLLKVFSHNECFTKIFAEKHGDIQQLFPEIQENRKSEKRKHASLKNCDNKN